MLKIVNKAMGFMTNNKGSHTKNIMECHAFLGLTNAPSRICTQRYRLCWVPRNILYSIKPAKRFTHCREDGQT